MARKPTPPTAFPPDLRVLKTSDERRREKLEPWSKKTGKLTAAQADLVLDWAAQLCSHRDIAERLRTHEDEAFRVEISHNAIGRYIQRHIGEVEDRRKRYMSDLGCTPLAFKRYRLSRLQGILDSTTDPYLALDVLKAAAVEMMRFGLFDRELGNNERDVREAEEFLLGIGVGKIDTERVLRRKR